jgi:hypothetical protein
MFTTTVIWAADQGPGADFDLDTAANNIFPGGNHEPNSTWDEQGSLKVVRSWATLEMAQAWVNYINENFTTISATVNIPD